MSRPTITRHYADGRPSETREMTELEFSQLTEELPADEIPIADSPNS